MLGDAPDSEADLQQRVRLFMAWQLVLGMVIWVDQEKAAFAQHSGGVCQAVLCSMVLSLSGSARKLCVACANDSLMCGIELLEGFLQRASGITDMCRTGTPSRCTCLWRRASLQKGRP